VWDPAVGLTNPASHHTLPTQTATNIFCSGQVNLPGTDGEVLILGGSQEVNGLRNYGTAHTQIFDSNAERLYLGENSMHQARWYPSVTVLGNGNVVAQVRVCLCARVRKESTGCCGCCS
jgi:galactose oxidase